MSAESKLDALADRWAGAARAERANAQPYLIELCTALEVDRYGRQVPASSSSIR